MVDTRQNSSPARARFRCAVYTRKSSEEGLEQEFNSLDAQREACEAYVTSQKHEGWTVLPALYDDGAYSGGTMDRPALQRMLDDIRAREIDVVVVYKVDRLTRSLGDFAKIVEVFDAQGVSFVSVTQAFNTTSSMGRLTLNVLLSFAQFEREVTGERIRDKIAASKKKGMWMGGLPSLGYDVKDRKLVVNEAEAATVRHIFQRYLELGAVRALQADLAATDVVSKRRTASDGSPYGGQRFSRGALYLMLKNRIYRGEIVHKGKAFPGEHAAIVDEELWQRVQSHLQENRIERREGDSAIEPSLLTGIVVRRQFRIHDADACREKGNAVSLLYLPPPHHRPRGRQFAWSAGPGVKSRSACHRPPARALRRSRRNPECDLEWREGCASAKEVEGRGRRALCSVGSSADGNAARLDALRPGQGAGSR